MVLGVTQSCPTLCDPKDSSPPGSSASGVLQARMLDIERTEYLLGRCEQTQVMWFYLMRALIFLFYLTIAIVLEVTLSFQFFNLAIHIPVCILGGCKGPEPLQDWVPRSPPPAPITWEDLIGQLLTNSRQLYVKSLS